MPHQCQDCRGNLVTRFTLQIPAELNNWLEEQARLNHRSKNKQIEHILKMSMDMDRLEYPGGYSTREMPPELANSGILR